MDKIIKITLIKSQIIEAVKNETFFKGQFDKAADNRAITVAYHEQAGNETYQERLLARALYTNIEELKTQLSDYISTSGFSSADNYIDSEEEEDNIILSLTVSSRFNNSFTNSLAKLASKYIEEAMLMDWWKPINEKQSALYAQFVERDLVAIKRCFNKTAPEAPTCPYTTILNLTGSAVDIEIGEQHTVTYSISDGAVDDIEARAEDYNICEIGRTQEGFTITGKQRGHTYISIYSRHNPDLQKTVHVYVTDHS